MSEIDKIRERYERRKLNKKVESFWFSGFAQCERESKYYEILRSNFKNISDINILEIGAGGGDNLLAIKRFGLDWQNIYANEPLDDRVEILKKNIPNANILTGDAMKLDFFEKFDVVFQSTVFISILDSGFKYKLAQKMFDMTKKDGLVLWYDFKYNNPSNKDVKGIDKKEIKKLFPEAKKIIFHNVTLAPPIGRKVGKFYNLANFLFPFFRTHLIAEIYK